mmetsp:Transcript_86861/g.202191  ORF Transcript_86861/g.202191 Transcript_86861/m.202191 type:complete len:200 (+) Transcript_86861:331-930(+)
MTLTLASCSAAVCRSSGLTMTGGAWRGGVGGKLEPGAATRTGTSAPGSVKACGARLPAAESRKVPLPGGCRGGGSTRTWSASHSSLNSMGTPASASGSCFSASCGFECNTDFRVFSRLACLRCSSRRRAIHFGGMGLTMLACWLSTALVSRCSLLVRLLSRAMSSHVGSSSLGNSLVLACSTLRMPIWLSFFSTSAVSA